MYFKHLALVIGLVLIVGAFKMARCEDAPEEKMHRMLARDRKKRCYGRSSKGACKKCCSRFFGGARSRCKKGCSRIWTTITRTPITKTPTTKSPTTKMPTTQTPTVSPRAEKCRELPEWGKCAGSTKSLIDFANSFMGNQNTAYCYVGFEMIALETPLLAPCDEQVVMKLTHTAGQKTTEQRIPAGVGADYLRACGKCTGESCRKTSDCLAVTPLFFFADLMSEKKFTRSCNIGFDMIDLLDAKLESAVKCDEKVMLKIVQKKDEDVVSEHRVELGVGADFFSECGKCNGE